MAKVHELLGVAIEQQGLIQALYETECEAHQKTVRLLGDLKAGRISLDRVAVEGKSWTVLSETAVQQIHETTVNEATPLNRMAAVLNGEAQG